MADDFLTVTPDSLHSFQWQPQSHLSLYKIQRELPPEFLEVTAPTLQHIKFENLTLRRNIELVLQHSPSLQSLTFTDVLIDEYDKSPASKTSVQLRRLQQHQNLTSITIKSASKISKKEHWLVAHLLQSVDLPNLRSFRLQKIYTEPKERDFSFDVVEKYGQDVEPNLITKYVLAHFKSLKELELGGAAIRISDKELDSRSLELLDQLILESLIFSWDAGGLGLFLRTQGKLRSLNCTHIFELGEASSKVASTTASILDAILSNHLSLVDIRLFPVLLVPRSRQTLMTENVLGAFAINCKCFRNCAQLKSLTLGLRAFQDEQQLTQPNSATLSGLRLTNLHHIPTHLSELYISLEEYSRDELELLANLFPKFVHLKWLYLGTSELNPLNVFLVKTWWVQSLLALPDIERFEFHNGRLEDPEAALKIIERIQTESGGSVVARMVYEFPSALFEKGWVQNTRA